MTTTRRIAVTGTDGTGKTTVHAPPTRRSTSIGWSGRG